MSDSKHVTTLNNKDDFTDFIGRNKRCIIFYSADWCGVCKERKPLYFRIANRYHKRIAFAYVDIDEVGMNINVVPIFDTYYKGEIIKSEEGPDPETLKELIKYAILYNTKQ